MFDIFHQWGADLTVDGTGDIALCGTSVRTTQRIYRRLVTNPGAYVWNLSYGAGLANFVGTPTSAQDIESVIRNQLQLEDSVASSPAPNIATQYIDAANGILTVTINYADRISASPVQMSLEVV
jgi:hypothetical protein